MTDRCLVCLGSLFVMAAVAKADAGAGTDSLPVPPIPVDALGEDRFAPTLPPVPRFEVPVAQEGVHDVRALRMRGDALLETEISVRGYVTWIYDCEKALARPGVPAEETRLLIADKPQLCERPKFSLGAFPRASPETSLWVVDVPRPPNKREQIALTPAQLEARPPAPRVALGDLVIVTGRFARQSPYGERSTDGLLIYRRLTHRAPPTRPATARSTTTWQAPVAPVTARRRVPVTMRDRNASVEQYEQCNRALENKQPDAAIAACRGALGRWRDNHLAWYALGHAHATRGDWVAASAAYAQAAELRPDAAMYLLHEGIALYEQAERHAHDAATSDRAVEARLKEIRRDRAIAGRVMRPIRLAVALSEAGGTSAATLERARRALTAAAQCAPRLWRAWYYAGLVARRQDPTRAAEAFTRAIHADPAQGEPYVALVQLYRAWDLHAEALAVARQATQSATTGPRAGVWYELGMACRASHLEDEALAAFTKAAAGTVLARFQRAQIYLRRKAFAMARPDLEAFLASPEASDPLLRRIAQRLLHEATRDRSSDDEFDPLPKRYKDSRRPDW